MIIAGGGPCGLMLANELGRRGISATLVRPDQIVGWRGNDASKAEDVLRGVTGRA